MIVFVGSGGREAKKSARRRIIISILSYFFYISKELFAELPYFLFSSGLCIRFLSEITEKLLIPRRIYGIINVTII